MIKPLSLIFLNLVDIPDKMKHLMIEPMSFNQQDSQDIASPTSPTSPLSDEEGKIIFSNRFHAITNFRSFDLFL